MKLNTPVRKRDEEANLIPLINIVFLLLIFFMLAGSFTQSDYFDVAPPASSAPQVAEAPTLIVLMSADGDLAIGEDELEMPALNALISARLAAEPGLLVQLKADGGLAAESLLDVMESLKAAGVAKLTLLAVAEDH